MSVEPEADHGAETAPNTQGRADTPSDPLGRLRTLPGVVYWLLGLFVATVVFWKLRIIDAATSFGVIVGNRDIYTEHYPMTKWGFERLFAGEIPHWNPYQLCGVPFQAIPHVGLFYPGNWIYGLFETTLAMELSFILHLFFAGAGMFLLVRVQGLSTRSALAAALTFMWSGWMIFYSNQASLVSGMSWLPTSVLMVELVVRGRYWAVPGLALAVAFQLFNGATDFFIYNMYVCGGYTLLRLGELGFGGNWPAALRRGGLLFGGVGCGILLATPQLLPSMALASESVRGGSALGFRQARLLGTVAPQKFLVDAIMTRDIVTVGVLPLAGMLLGAATRKRGLFALALIFVLLSASLVFGDKVFWLYFHTPLGDIFRRPHKFLHIYAFFQAWMAALALLGLEGWIHESRRTLLRKAGYLITVVGLCAAATHVLRQGLTPIALLVLIAGLLLFALFEAPWLRRGVLVGLLALQAANLFFAVEQKYVRPWVQPQRFLTYDTLLRKLRDLAGSDRVYIPSDFHFLPGLMEKSGLLYGFRVVGDYEPLASKRAGEFFRTITPPRGNAAHSPFSGAIGLAEDSLWPLMDLTSTRFYVVRARTPLDDLMMAEARRPKQTGVVLRQKGNPRLYERTTALPRAYFVTGAKLAESPEAALSLLRGEGFAPRREVVLEEAPPTARRAVAPVPEAARVAIVEDGRERIVLEVDAPSAGYVVLTDAYSALWEASAKDEAVRLYRANYLFRAMPVDPGWTTLTLRYRAVPFRRGLVISVTTLVVLLGAIAVGWRRGAMRETRTA